MGLFRNLHIMGLISCFSIGLVYRQTACTEFPRAFSPSSIPKIPLHTRKWVRRLQTWLLKVWFMDNEHKWLIGLAVGSIYTIFIQSILSSNQKQVPKRRRCVWAMTPASLFCQQCFAFIIAKIATGGGTFIEIDSFMMSVCAPCKVWRALCMESSVFSAFFPFISFSSGGLGVHGSVRVNGVVTALRCRNPDATPWPRCCR